MNTRIYVICRDDKKIITKFCKSWFELIQFIENYQGIELFCTLDFSEWFLKLQDWRSRQCQDQNIMIES